MDIILTNVIYNLAIVFRGLVNVLINYYFHTENKLLCIKKHILCMKTAINHYSMHKLIHGTLGMM